MQVIWEREAGDVAGAAIRIIVDDDGCIMFQYRSMDLPEWTDVDELPMRFDLAI